MAYTVKLAFDYVKGRAFVNGTAVSVDDGAYIERRFHSAFDFKRDNARLFKLIEKRDGAHVVGA